MAPTDLTSLIIFPLPAANHPKGPFIPANLYLCARLFRPIFTLIEVFSVLSAFARPGPCGLRIWIWLCLPFRHMQSKQEQDAGRCRRRNIYPPVKV